MGTPKWKSLKNSNGQRGVRYREHRSRRHGVQPDRYYALEYWLDGRARTEGVGWASAGIKPTDCFDLLAQLKKNQALGEGPRTLAEMREHAELEREAKRNRQAAAKRLNVSFKTFFDDSFLPDAKRHWAPETSRKAAEHVKNWIAPVIGSLPFREIKKGHLGRIRARLSEASRSARTQQYVFRTLTQVWNAALDDGLVDVQCPTTLRSWRLPKVDNQRERVLTPGEEKVLLEKVKARSQQAHDMAVVGLDAGLRFGEIAALTWGAVDVNKASLLVLDTKTHVNRIVPMTERLVKLFRSLPAGQSGDLVFSNSRGGIQTFVPSSFIRGLSDAKLNEGVKNKKLRVSFYTLRHTYATRLAEAGVGLYKIQRLMGHTSPVTTQRYAKLSHESLRKAVGEMERHQTTEAEQSPEAKSDHMAKVIPLQKKNARR